MDDKLTANPHAWNQRANILFLESPGGVGFSFQADGHYNVTDSTVAELNFQALQSFYKKFPHFAENDFYITGESYAGKSRLGCLVCIVYTILLLLRHLHSHAV